MSPEWVAPISKNQDLGARVGGQHREGRPYLVVEVPGGRRDPLARVTEHGRRAQSLVVVLPTVPVMPTTIGRGRLRARSVHRASPLHRLQWIFYHKRLARRACGRRPVGYRAAQVCLRCKSCPIRPSAQAKNSLHLAPFESQRQRRAPACLMTNWRARSEYPRDLLEGSRPHRNPSLTSGLRGFPVRGTLK
jgi:hypothetical protein